MKDEYIEPTLGGRIALVIFYSLIISWFVFAQEIIISPIADYVTTLDFCESLPWVKGEVIYAIVASSMIILLLLVRAYQIFKYKQSPAPNTFVFKRTIVSRSNTILVRGYMFLILALAVIGVLVYTWFYFDISLIFSSAAETECG